MTRQVPAQGADGQEGTALASAAGTVTAMNHDARPAHRPTTPLEVSSVKSRTAFPATLAAALAAVALLAGCSSPAATPEPKPSSTAATQSGEPSAPAEPVPSASPANEFSQEVDGVLYEGTEVAPARVGADAPGQPPAAEAQLTRENYEQLATEQDKYVVYVFEDVDDGGYLWKVFGQSRHGSFRQLSWSLDSGEAGRYGASAEAQAAQFVVDGRVLDRSEYLLFVEP